MRRYFSEMLPGQTNDRRHDDDQEVWPFRGDSPFGSQLTAAPLKEACASLTSIGRIADVSELMREYTQPPPHQ